MHAENRAHMTSIPTCRMSFILASILITDKFDRPPQSAAHILYRMTNREDTTPNPQAIRAALGSVVLSRRIEAGLDRELFARMAGLGASHVRRIEIGEVAPSVVTLRKLADAFGCSWSDLLDDADAALSRQTDENS